MPGEEAKAKIVKYAYIIEYNMYINNMYRHSESLHPEDLFQEDLLDEDTLRKNRLRGYVYTQDISIDNLRTEDLRTQEQWKRDNEFLELISRHLGESGSEIIKHVLSVECDQHVMYMRRNIEKVSKEDQWKRDDEFINRISQYLGESGSEIIKRVYLVEGEILFDHTKNLSREDQWKERDEFLEHRIPQNFRSEITKGVLDVECNQYEIYMRDNPEKLTKEKQWEKDDEFLERISQRLVELRVEDAESVHSEIAKRVLDMECDQYKIYMRKNPEKLTKEEQWEKDDKFLERISQRLVELRVENAESVRSEIAKGVLDIECDQYKIYMRDNPEKLTKEEQWEKDDKFLERISQRLVELSVENAESVHSEIAKRVLDIEYKQYKIYMRKNPEKLTKEEQWEKDDKFLKHISQYSRYFEKYGLEIVEEVLDMRGDQYEIYMRDNPEKLTKEEQWEKDDEFLKYISQYPRYFEKYGLAIVEGVLDIECDQYEMYMRDNPEKLTKEEQWEKDDEFLERISQRLVELSVENAESVHSEIAKRVLDMEYKQYEMYMRDNPEKLTKEEQWEKDDEFLKHISQYIVKYALEDAESVYSRFAEKVYDEEAGRLLKDTKDLPIEKQWEKHKEFLDRIPENFGKFRERIAEYLYSEEKKRYPIINTKEELREFIRKYEHKQQHEFKEPSTVRLLEIVKETLDHIHLEKGFDHQEMINAAIKSNVVIEGQESGIDHPDLANVFYKECLGRIEASKNPRWSESTVPRH